jgi:hypothetical protein
VIVFSVENPDAVTTTENTLSPAATMAVGRSDRLSVILRLQRSCRK